MLCTAVSCLCLLGVPIFDVGGVARGTLGEGGVCAFGALQSCKLIASLSVRPEQDCAESQLKSCFRWCSP